MRILFFAQVKDATRCDFLDIDSASPLDAGQLWEELLRQFPALSGHRASVRLAKNHEYAGPDARFGNGDEVALIPPVSGG